jgi:hypothetical protein
VIAACADHIPLRKVPAHVIVIRDGHRLHKPPRARPNPPRAPTPPSSTTGPAKTVPVRLFLQAGDEIRVSRPGEITFAIAGNRYRVRHGVLRLGCRRALLGFSPSAPRTAVLAVDLQSGRVEVRSGLHARRALALTREMLAFATVRDTHFVVDRDPAANRTRAWTSDQRVVTAKASDQALRVNTRTSYTAISDARGLRLDIWPFSISRLQRPPIRADRLKPFWADGGFCSVGCTASGTPGWPIKPFHQQHAIRAGINELRPANFHVGVDIEAADLQWVYAIQSGSASWTPTGSYGDYKVTVGPFTYWHIVPNVANGQYVVAYKTKIGAIETGFGHLAFQEGGDNGYLNPLRPGGNLRPYTDSEPPVIGIPRVFSDGHVIVGTFDPQSFIHKESYETPVLAPAALAWRLYNARGRPLTGLEWAMRGSGYISPGLKPVIFAPGASNPGFECFYTKLRCIPNWVYNLAGGLTQPLPLGSLARGRYRLTVYAWDWAGNRSALDDWIKLPIASAASAFGAPSAEFGPLNPNFDP